MSLFTRIHKLSHSIEEVATEKIFDTEIYELKNSDLLHVTKANGWHFDWRKELNTPGRKVYKLVIENDEAIQGLLSMEDRGNYFFLPLIESAPHNFGRVKKYRGVPQSLTAFA